MSYQAKLIYLFFNYNILTFTETWLLDQVNSCELGFFNYEVYRCDSSYLSCTSKRGACVLLAVGKNLVSSVINTDDKFLELCLISVKLNCSKNVIVGCLFFHQKPPISYYTVISLVLSKT